MAKKRKRRQSPRKHVMNVLASLSTYLSLVDLDYSDLLLSLNNWEEIYPLTDVVSTGREVCQRMGYTVDGEGTAESIGLRIYHGDVIERLLKMIKKVPGKDEIDGFLMIDDKGWFKLGEGTREMLCIPEDRQALKQIRKGGRLLPGIGKRALLHASLKKSAYGYILRHANAEVIEFWRGYRRRIFDPSTQQMTSYRIGREIPSRVYRTEVTPISLPGFPMADYSSLA